MYGSYFAMLPTAPAGSGQNLVRSSADLLTFPGRAGADVTLISPDRPVKVSQVSDATLQESTGQLPIEPPNDRWPLGFIASQLFILRPLDGSDSLFLRCAACNHLLN